MKTYNKLVRDRIVEIIEDSGRSCTHRVLGDEEYLKELKIKLHEEVQEFLQAESNVDCVEELADVLEVVFALATLKGASMEQLIAVRDRKKEERGGFTDRLFLETVTG